MTTTWEPCKACGATVRHDDGICIRDPRHPRFTLLLPGTPRGTTARVAENHGPIPKRARP